MRPYVLTAAAGTEFMFIPIFTGHRLYYHLSYKNEKEFGVLWFKTISYFQLSLVSSVVTGLMNLLVYISFEELLYLCMLHFL